MELKLRYYRVNQKNKRWHYTGLISGDTKVITQWDARSRKHYTGILELALCCSNWPVNIPCTHTQLEET